MSKKTVLCCVGTRPEAIKMAPVIQRLQESDWARCRVLATAQHRDLLDQMLHWFGIDADLDLDMMRPGQTLAELTAGLVKRLDPVLEAEQPEMVLAQGDTTTVFCSALTCFYRGVPFGHVEAGLRSGQLNSPFPEEANRILCSHLSTLHFAPTESARENLLREGIRGDFIFVTGNTVIDALLWTAERSELKSFSLDPAKRLVLITAHRRENFGAPLQNVCSAVRELSRRYPDVEFIWPVHPNPNVQPVVEKNLKGRSNVRLCQPLSYGEFVAAMKRACLLLTDSGGLQEEGPALAKPVLVMRDTSERPEALEAGVARLVGTATADIVNQVSLLLEDRVEYRRMSRAESPFGDGQASRRITSILHDFLHLGPRVQTSPDPMRRPASAFD